MQRYAILSVLALIPLVLVGCLGMAPHKQTDVAQGAIAFDISLAALEDSGRSVHDASVELKRGSVVRNEELTIVDSVATGVFDDVLVGAWDVTVRLYDEEGTLVGEGIDTVEVLPHETVTVSLHIKIYVPDPAPKSIDPPTETFISQTYTSNAETYPSFIQEADGETVRGYLLHRSTNPDGPWSLVAEHEDRDGLWMLYDRSALMEVVLDVVEIAWRSLTLFFARFHAHPFQMTPGHR